ncbi:hypothetical protein CAEBREN_18223 [Caenorhabditis brenneri]|uniref:Homeobox domain-containing protein n=1 Tax=Caenorhabditis brenneri TaxID=135651 RepID=G0PM92_CAEBE|nr:hypothetical protein CAEBREN_18223 [Caenorhabditis brenneri]
MDITSSLIQTSRQSNELSEDSGIQASPSSSKSSSLLKNLQMSKEDIEDMIEEAFKKSDDSSMITKKYIQAATGMSLEAICNFYSHKKRALKKEAARQVPHAQSVSNNLQGPISNIPQSSPISQFPISPNPAKLSAFASFSSLPLQFSPPWILNKNDESSEDSGIQSRSSSMGSSIVSSILTDLEESSFHSLQISPQNYRDYKMTRDEIEELLEQTYRQNNYPKMETKKLIQSKTGMSIEAINQRFQKKRKMDQPDLTLPKRAPVPFSMDIREKLLEKYVLGEKVSLEEREALSRDTGLTLKQINDFYCKKNTAMRNKLLRNPELQAEDLQNLARKYRKFHENHEDEQKNGGIGGDKNGEMTDGVRTWVTFFVYLAHKIHCFKKFIYSTVQ